VPTRRRELAKLDIGFGDPEGEVTGVHLRNVCDTRRIVLLYVTRGAATATVFFCLKWRMEDAQPLNHRAASHFYILQ